MFTSFRSTPSLGSNLRRGWAFRDAELDVKREVSIQIPGTAFRGVLAVFEVHSRNLVGMELLDHFQSLRGQTCKFWPLRGQNGVK